MNTFDAIAFDIDGTLYPNYRAIIHLLPHVIKEPRLVNAFSKARRIIRREPTNGSFFDAQAEIIARILGDPQAEVKARVENVIYRTWSAAFAKIKPYANVRETLELLRGAGYRTAAMSDFPPHEKLKRLKLSGLWDAEIGSEFSGRLKPDSKPFLKLAQALKLPPQRILYIGNSIRYDIAGAKNVGMQAALIEPFPRLRRACDADFVFRNYRQLQRILLAENPAGKKEDVRPHQMT